MSAGTPTTTASSTGAEPPAYSITPEPGSTTVPQPTQQRCSILETRQLILDNAAILKPRGRDDEVILTTTRRKLRQDSAEDRPVEQHYAFLAMRKPSDKAIAVLLKTPPQPSKEAALEYLLAQSETVVEDMLMRHGQNIASLGCCVECMTTLRRAK